MEKARYRIEVFHKITDPRGEVLARKLRDLGFPVDRVFITDNYFVNADITREDANRAGELLSQPVIQDYTVNSPHIPGDFICAAEIGFLPGVTDNVSHTVRESIEDLLKTDLDREKSVFSSVTYFFQGSLAPEMADDLVMELHNPLIERCTLLAKEEYLARGGMGYDLPVVHITDSSRADRVDLDLPDDQLMEIARHGIQDGDGSRRGPLALDLPSMHVIKDYFLEREKRKPTDIELESIAQTWSEHCKHTIFSASMDSDIPEGIYRRYIKEATMRIRREKGENDFCLSVFKDNSGGIEFNENYIISDKVETHNSPSALDPFGGSVTGIVGVNRDAIGFGMAARPVANRYGFCFASPFDESPLYRDKSKESRLLPPRRIMEGVVHGVNVGGNNSGIPTPQGFVYFDPRYKGKPLVFVGTVGLLPKRVNGEPAVEKRAMDGDHVVMVGGRVGRDGIHGATFSSEALTSGSPATAVQIGDPITQKKLSDAIVKEARDRGLYHSITDNGAGGLSCSVAEMARESGGFEVDLEKVPLKYPGLSPWQIWVSESQERMTLSVPEENLDEFIKLMSRRGVEATVIGRFTDSGRGVVCYNGEKIFDLDMTFLHEGLPKKQLSTTYTRKKQSFKEFPEPEDLGAELHGMMKRLNLASYGFISRQYDHEVQGNSVIKPLQGKGEVNGNATVIRPLFDSNRGVVLSQGLYPSYSDIDTYWMAACSIDTAIRNAITAGGALDRLALLDNFCWCDSTNPERLGQLKEAARACYDIAVAYGTPYISGKDSMFNDFKGYDENFNEIMISIPPTLLISSIGIIDDISTCQTIDFKAPGDFLYLIGLTRDETGGSEYLAHMGEKLSGAPYIGSAVPEVDPPAIVPGYRAVEKALRKGLAASAVSLERGGLAAALAKSSMAGLLGFEADLRSVPADGVARNDTILFSETQGRVLLTVNPVRRKEFEELCGGVPCALVGRVAGGSGISVTGLGGKEIIREDVGRLLESYRSVFRGF